MPAKIQIRRATAAQWTGSEILSAGEIGFETDTGNTKIGDGSTTWTNLAYQFPVQTGARSSALTGGTATLAIDNANDRVGIGTTNPTTKLDVDGTLRATGNTTVGGTLSVTGNTTLSGDLAVNAATNADITTTTSTATVFNTNATALNIGGAATTIGIGAATGTTTINNAAAIAGAATVGGTLAVTGNTTLTGNLEVNSGVVTTNQTTATVFNTNATTLNVGQAAATVSIGALTGTATIRNATTAITGAATVGGTLGVTGATTLTGALAANGGIDAVTFNGAPSWASNPSSANHLVRKGYLDTVGTPSYTDFGNIFGGTVYRDIDATQLTMFKVYAYRVYGQTDAQHYLRVFLDAGEVVEYSNANTLEGNSAMRWAYGSTVVSILSNGSNVQFVFVRRIA